MTDLARAETHQFYRQFYGFSFASVPGIAVGASARSHVHPCAPSGAHDPNDRSPFRSSCGWAIIVARGRTYASCTVSHEAKRSSRT
ncbi:hypothetical protein BQ8482_110873 [Mesorhizobium delmotii]|uniref:Uncharacterized protein n=1 Tax=Mesorhizobium delmotii TaxID=1631247 RepID=A0A2P9ACV3_9HYPH|nr:hypothetical protein BQ8482_110873 [Mesorhizobium delmotii]